MYVHKLRPWGRPPFCYSRSKYVWWRCLILCYAILGICVTGSDLRVAIKYQHNTSSILIWQKLQECALIMKAAFAAYSLLSDK